MGRHEVLPLNFKPDGTITVGYELLVHLGKRRNIVTSTGAAEPRVYASGTYPLSATLTAAWNLLGELS